MPFSATEFLPMSGMANSNAPRHWTYTTPDTKAVTVAASYFDDAVKMGLQQGDIIWAVGVNGGVEVFTMIFVDAISAAGVVTTLSSTLTLA